MVILRKLSLPPLVKLLATFLSFNMKTTLLWRSNNKGRKLGSWSNNLNLLIKPLDNLLQKSKYRETLMKGLVILYCQYVRNKYSP